MIEHDCMAPVALTDDDRRDGWELLQMLLPEIEAHDDDYTVRNVMVLMAVAIAKSAGLEAGFRIDPAEPDWPVAYIELPTGQVSWHMPQHPREYDGHTTEEKYARCRAFAEQEAS
jgi:hypothetical protein